MTILLAGVVAPAMGKKNEKEPEPHAREAKYFAELSVLNRDVRVVFVGKDKYGTGLRRCCRKMITVQSYP